jgi:hypothetical protein
MTPPDPLPSPTANIATSPAQKGVATVRRHKDERRAELLHDIDAQIANGTLVVRQMTDAEHKTASPAAASAGCPVLHRGKQEPR